MHHSALQRIFARLIRGGAIKFTISSLERRRRADKGWMGFCIWVPRQRAGEEIEWFRHTFWQPRKIHMNWMEIPIGKYWLATCWEKRHASRLIGIVNKFEIQLGVAVVFGAISFKLTAKKKAVCKLSFLASEKRLKWSFSRDFMLLSKSKLESRIQTYQDICLCGLQYGKRGRFGDQNVKALRKQEARERAETKDEKWGRFKNLSE